MAEKRKGKKRKDDYMSKDDVVEKPSKDEINVANWLKKNVPIKKTKFLSHNVIYFTGKRAVDALVESKFYNEEDGLFKSRDQIVNFMDLMLSHKFYHRARKVPISDAELKAKRKDKKEAKDSEDDKNRDGKGTDAESSVVESKQDKEVSKEKKKKKIRLEMHNDQRFVDSLDAYVWIYDPIPLYYWVIGAFSLLGCVGLCLFPLWPQSVRILVYYLSVAAAGFLVSIIVLAVLRLIFFCLVWVLTAGKHHIWILPNLTEDVGFFASFWPLYTYEYRGEGYVPPKKGRKKKKDKDSDAEEENTTEKTSKSVQDGGEETVSAEERLPEAASGAENVAQVSESESESSQRSSTGKDFEMVEEVELIS
ncbi:unnamed protein product [Brassicogethes aeneus]|uniref:Translocation protein SEC62 n=1 Tax=Brassicogethes aeneus TaxID=1431903 RepID=A0A9P0BDI3_BRAAE|nr:unnamed protein product [Brassicogethes aeneus]